MTTFPTLNPNSINLEQGQPQVSEYQSFGIGPIRFKHNNFVNDQKVVFTYRGLDQTSVELLRDHYQNNSGTAARFAVPVSLFGGLNIFTASSVFRYTETPTEEHTGVQLYNVSVAIQAIEGIDLLFILDGGPATLPTEAAFAFSVFSGTEPFILNGSDSTQATLVLNAD